MATGQIILSRKIVQEREFLLKHYCQESYIYLIGFAVFCCIVGQPLTIREQNAD